MRHTSPDRRRHRGLLAPLLAVLLTCTGVTASHAGSAGQPLASGILGPRTVGTTNPTVEGPVPDGRGDGGIHGHPWYDPAFEVGSQGYVQEEYFLSGVARTYPSTGSPASADYKTRVLVLRPTVASGRFNGTVVVEWDNVTAQAAFSPMFTWFHQQLLREGYAFMSVSAQAAGICCSPLSHRVWDPVRYSSLRHPGDDYSFDIYSQAAQSFLTPVGTDPMGGLAVEEVIGVGQSQSAGRLHTYVNQVHDQVGLVDGFILDAGGSKNFPTAPSSPVIHFLSEDGISAAAPNRLGHPNYRLWEVPAASHNDADTARHIDGGQAQRNSVDTPQFPYAEDERLHAEGLHYGEQGPSTFAGCQVIGEGGNEYPRRYAVQAALDHLNRWVTEDIPAPQPPRVEFGANGAIVRDEFGHPLGGVRLPPIDVPVARYLATTCALFGQTIAFDSATLLRLYPTHGAYVAAMQEAADDAVAAGFMLPVDAEELMDMASGSAIPLGVAAP